VRNARLAERVRFLYTDTRFSYTRPPGILPF
jgi:hypothetical protein